MQALVNAWYQKSVWLWLLLPLSWCYQLLFTIRKYCYRLGVFSIYRAPVQVVVIGNITVGGTGKTPLVIELAKHLQTHGFQPGIISRGYGGNKTQPVKLVDQDSDWRVVGDEALLIAQNTQCPVAVSKSRRLAIEQLLKQDCDIIISDDGLQHYALARDIEIVVIDGQRLLGNQQCLPAGPLRESARRLNSVDFIVHHGEVKVDGYQMQLQPQACYQLINPRQTKSLAEFKNTRVHAVAGIGHPQRFFDMLEKKLIEVIAHPFPDHYWFKGLDFEYADQATILLTEKDAVKCKSFADKRFWVVPVQAEVSPKLINGIIERLV